MDIRQLARVDLNLLIALQALLEEGNVSRAAERVFISQSAMSKTLGRLRQLFDDPLFTRTATGVVPTPRAEALQQPLSEVLKMVEGLIAPVEFEPSAYVGEFTLEVPDYLVQTLVPRLMAKLGQEAPGIRLQVVNYTGREFERLTEGDVDFAIQIEHHHYAAELNIIELGKASMVMLARKGHPLQDATFTAEDLVSYPYIRLFIPDIEETEFFHQNMELFKRYPDADPGLDIAQLHTALEVLKCTDYVMPSPSLLIGGDMLDEHITLLPLPFSGSFESRYVMVWHRRTEQSLPHRYMRDKIVAVINAYRSQHGLALIGTD